MRNSRHHRRGRLAGHAVGGVARLVLMGLFAWWLVAALQCDRVTVAGLTLAIVLVEVTVIE